MIKEERFTQILKQLKKQGRVTFAPLAELLNVSEDTIRRDIDLMNKSGLLVKVRGGAIPISKSLFSFRDRMNYLSHGKEIIGMKALQFVKKNKTIFLDGGTSVCAFASLLPKDTVLRVITNNQAVVPILSDHKNIELIILGGRYNAGSQTTSGRQTCDEIKHFIADLYFMGVCSVDKEFGITSSVQEDGESKQAMRRAAKKVIVLCNSEKLNDIDFFHVCDITSIDVLITELPGNDKMLDRYRDLDLEII